MEIQSYRATEWLDLKSSRYTASTNKIIYNNLFLQKGSHTALGELVHFCVCMYFPFIKSNLSSF
jgi:hypothetical protein